MNCGTLPSEQLIATRDRLKPFVHGGKFFSSSEITALVRRLNTVVALAEELEEENRLLVRTARVTETIVTCAEAYGGKVTVLRPRPRVEQPTGGGGDAA